MFVLKIKSVSNVTINFILSFGTFVFDWEYHTLREIVRKKWTRTTYSTVAFVLSISGIRAYICSGIWVNNSKGALKPHQMSNSAQGEPQVAPFLYTL